jgi:hypothetical protein
MLTHVESHRKLEPWRLDLIVAFPALFWGGVYLRRREPLGYVAGGIVLLKAAAETLTLALQAWVTVAMGGPGDPLVPVYAVVGLGGLALLVGFLRRRDCTTAWYGRQHCRTAADEPIVSNLRHHSRDHPYLHQRGPVRPCNRP